MDICERCDQRPATETDDLTGELLCSTCVENKNEAAYERSIAAYYGGSRPLTDAERYEAASRQKRELR